MAGGLDRAWFDPLASGAVFNEVARFLVAQRDRRMVRKLVDEVRMGNRVIAVAGVSHVVMQERALRELLGLPAGGATGDCH